MGWERQSKEEESVDKGMMVGKVADVAHEESWFVTDGLAASHRRTQFKI